MENRYLTLKETAEMTHTAYATVKRDVDNGKLTAYKLGRKYFIAADAAAASLSARKTWPTIWRKQRSKCVKTGRK
ncbi:MAG: helix-turn-helix domain-containing protein [Firmicutes bacterium]|nr:helix-turn-helix domain-containing protein [Bacillota bacterium]